MDDTKLVRVLKALADRKRLRMMQEIAEAGELSCGQVAERFDVSQPTVSHHLKILTDAGVLSVREAGQHRFISVNRELINQVAAFLPTNAAPHARTRRTTGEPKGAR